MARWVSAVAFQEHDPEKWEPVFPRDKREAFARRSCSNKGWDHDPIQSDRIMIKGSEPRFTCIRHRWVT
jgi:hypothetical protein